MNGWDVMSWVSMAVLAVGGIVIFTLFVRDLRRPQGGEPQRREDTEKNTE